MTNTPQDIRGTVLGWGDGARLKEFARECLGSEAPMQFCAFLGHRTRLQHGVHRAAMLIPQIRVVVATEHHRRYVEGGLEPAAPGLVLFQSDQRDTASGILLPLANRALFGYIRGRGGAPVGPLRPTGLAVHAGRRLGRAVSYGEFQPTSSRARHRAT